MPKTERDEKSHKKLTRAEKTDRKFDRNLANERKTFRDYAKQSISPDFDDKEHETISRIATSEAGHVNKLSRIREKRQKQEANAEK